ncbi:MAG: PHP domain-containing protein, partial [Bacilli bacterium]|nr:PHP domain-containing protein [Bacilli bacterium]
MPEEEILYPGSVHNHTDYSNFRLRDSTNTVKTLIDQAIKLGHEVVAITEHETIASAIDAENYYNKIKKDNPNFKVILGNEIYLCRNGLNPRNYDTSQDKWYHFILLAKDEIGHKQ